MREDIKVHVVKYKDRRNLCMRYVDPLTGKQQTRSTGTHKKREAERVAAKWEAELQEGRYKSASKVTWEEFRERYEQEVLSSFAGSSFKKVSSCFNHIERILSPKRLGNLTSDRISILQAQMRKEGLAENTIKGNLAHLKAALNWANRVGMLPDVPKIDMPRRARDSKMMRGRPITGEEFDRMIEAVAQVVGEERAASWKHLLYGFWWSGLRLGEMIDLYWDRSDKLQIDLLGKRPMLRIPAELEKGNKDRLLPIAPEFAEMLLSVPELERTGPVFSPAPKFANAPRLQIAQIGKVISDIGASAGIKVNTDQRTGKIKYASAHDLRRSFGERWANLVMPHILKELMRHHSIDTTMKFYVGRNAEATTETLYLALSGNSLGNTPAFSQSQDEKGMSQVVESKGFRV